MTDKEKITIQKYAAFLHDNEICDEFLVSIMKLTLKRMCAGSASYLASKYNYTTQYINRICKRYNVCGLTIYTQAF